MCRAESFLLSTSTTFIYVVPECFYRGPQLLYKSRHPELVSGSTPLLFLRPRSPITNFGDDNLLDPEQKPLRMTSLFFFYFFSFLPSSRSVSVRDIRRSLINGLDCGSTPAMTALKDLPYHYIILKKKTSQALFCPTKQHPFILYFPTGKRKRLTNQKK